MTKNTREKLSESAKSVLPICFVVLILNFTICKMPLGTFALFLSSILFLILGMSLFSLGTEMAMIPIGKMIGAYLTRSRKMWLLLGGSLVMGVIVTLAEPDLQVLTTQVPAIPDTPMMFSIAIGVGLFLMFGMLRIVFNLDLSKTFVIFYALLFVVAAFSDADFIAVAFDSGGVTTGAITVPFILALGAGVSAIKKSNNSGEDSFGLCALCSIGPIIAMLILGLLFGKTDSQFAYQAPVELHSFKELLKIYFDGFVHYSDDVFSALVPIIIIFLVLQGSRYLLSRLQFIKVMIGLVYSFVGLTMFLTGVNIGFMPAGRFIGNAISQLDYNWIIVPLGMLLGFLVVLAEPAVHVLNTQVEDITSGSVSKNTVTLGIALGVSAGIGLSMLRIMTGISIMYFIIPGYAIALALTFIVPDLFTAVAFDSGGVASGAMTVAFLLPLALGACEGFGGDPMKDAFGIVSMVAMMPLVSIQLIGLIFKLRIRKGTTDELDVIRTEIPVSVENEKAIAVSDECDIDDDLVIIEYSWEVA